MSLLSSSHHTLMIGQLPEVGKCLCPKILRPIRPHKGLLTSGSVPVRVFLPAQAALHGYCSGIVTARVFIIVF